MQVSSWTVAYESLFFSAGLEQKWNPEVLDGYRCDKTFTPVSEKNPLYLILFRRWLFFLGRMWEACSFPPSASSSFVRFFTTDWVTLFPNLVLLPGFQA